MDSFTPTERAPGLPTLPTDSRQIDEAMDYAARVARAIVGEFVAAPAGPAGGPAAASIEVAVEFFVPPASPRQFADELDRALVRRSLAYAAARRSGAVAALTLTVLPPGAFHQWRSAWKVDPRTQHTRRWSDDRTLLDGVLHQARTGWRELLTAG
jgi:hypothetical protein